MKKSILAVVMFSLLTANGNAQLKGFYYGDDPAPGGHEWQSPDSLAYNKEQPRATFWRFPSEKSALAVLPDGSSWHMSLNGQWSFNWVKTPDLRPADFFRDDYDTSSWDKIEVPSNWNIVGLQPDGSQRYGTPIYVNQPVIFQHKVAVDDWRGGVMRTPPEDWTTFEARNEVGSYKRSFTIPEDWNGREVYINFDGVDSFFYLWINGHYVGFSKNSRNAARFDITRWLRKGENTVAVEVYRSSDGSFFESQDMFRLPGIFRSVSLYCTSKIQISDMVAIPDLTDNYKNGELNVSAIIRNLSGKNVKGCKLTYSLYANKLYSDELISASPVATLTTHPFGLGKADSDTIITKLCVEKPNLWSAEQPWRYTLVATLSDKGGKRLETVSAFTGFRKVEILDTPAENDEFGEAGRYFYVNGQPVKLKGVNRHETNPERGHAIERSQMEKEVMLMKRANINHVRNSHYPDDPYWYYLCDKYGIYLEDEANLESHQYYYGKASLSHVPEMENAHVARDMEMVHSTVNSPSIVIWSLGNEAGPGNNFITAYNAIKAFDTSRPVQYERNNDIVDMGSNQYPSIAWTREAVKGKMKIKYPFHISEYAHSMGNAVGNLVDYWNAIESTNHFMGGAIWDWVDQSLYNYTPDAPDGRYLAFGGDFGDNPSDGQFVMNGIVFGDLSPKPQYWEVKKVYQNIGVSPVDVATGKIEIFNKNYFTDLSDYELVWTLSRNGVKAQQSNVFNGTLPQARQRSVITIPFDRSLLNDSTAEWTLETEFRLLADKPWADAGYTQMSEQLTVSRAVAPAPISASADQARLKPIADGNLLIFYGQNFKATFDIVTGTLSELIYGSQNMILPGEGPRLEAFRAYLNNDIWVAGQWFSNGLYNLKHYVKSYRSYLDPEGNNVLEFVIESQAPRGGKMIGGNGNSRGTYSIDESESKNFGTEDFTLNTIQTWTVRPDGSIELAAVISSNNPALILPRLGYTMQMPEKFNDVTYYGRGPEENYNDRRTGQFTGVYSTTVEKMFTPYTRPQSNANREDVRWAAITDGKNGKGLLFVAPDTMSFAALPYAEMELFSADHVYKLPKSNRTVVHLDMGVTGLGGSSCGQGGPLEHDRVRAGEHRFSLIIRPVEGVVTDAMTYVGASDNQPLGITRTRQGELRLSFPDPTATILYTINDSRKPSIYNGPFDLSKGGNIKAWLKDNPAIEARAQFSILPTIATEAIYASSEEPDYGEATNLTDGNAETVWHTMYSVTVAPFPHWVDFDAGSEKRLSGVTYLPRQDGNTTGDVKDYEIYVSTDGRNWGEPVAKGQFDSTKSRKTVKFENSINGRYVRFMTLSAQNGRDYAAGAEFEVLAEQ